MTAWSFNRCPGKGVAYVLLRDNEEAAFLSFMDAPVWPDIILRGVCDLLEIDGEVGP
jgi:hypothetical protein